MTAAALLARLTGLGVSAEVDHGALRLRPASVIPPDLLAEVRASKAEVLALLTPPPPVDLGELPAGPCPVCGGGQWWRLSVLSGGPGRWRCERCMPPDPAHWIDGCAVPSGEAHKEAINLACGAGNANLRIE